MEVLKIQKDYGWVLKVLDSCKTKEQVDTCQTLFNNFIYKWIHDLSEERTLTFNWNFQKHKSQKLITIKNMTSRSC